MASLVQGGLASAKKTSSRVHPQQCVVARRVGTAHAAPASFNKLFRRNFLRRPASGSRGGGETIAFQGVNSVDSEDAVSTAPTAEGAKSSDTFAWERNWWPVHVLAYLDPSRPTPVELLGMQLVLWCDAAGTWRCFRDSCPHRRVPLSEGRVEGGELVCSYHGWRFNEGGACTAIPQAPDAKSLAAATASPRSCVTSFPTKEMAGLLWVWPEDSPLAAANAAAVPQPLPNAFDQPEFKESLLKGWYMREMPYDYDILVENVADPSHLPYSHHAALPGLDRKTAPPMPFSPIKEGVEPTDADLLPTGDPSICAFEYPTAQVKGRRVRFYAPGIITYFTKPYALTVTLQTPVGPGRSKLFVTNAFSISMPPPNLLKKLTNMVLGPAVLTALTHLYSMRVFDGDSVFLNKQGHFLRAAERQAAGKGPAWPKEYFMPMTSDRAVVGARRWIDAVGGGGPVYPAEALPATQQVTREQLLDRLGQHTKHCRDCRAGLEFAGRLVTAGQALQAASFFALCCLAGTYGFRALFTGGLPSLGVVAAAACSWGASWLRVKGEQLQKDFTFTNYVHADIP